ncbi:MAG: aspartate-semialdehyde dehydrogenase [Chlamydiales bacterium]
MLKVAILGATGLIGQHYLYLLQNHPWFTPTFLAASPKSAGQSYRETMHNRWHLPYPIPTAEVLRTLEEIHSTPIDLIFSALPAPLAQEYEPRLAAAGFPVISSASSHRSESDIPVLIPEINPSHLNIIAIQKQKRHYQRGFIVAKPNCAIQSFLLPLAPLHSHFHIRSLSITTLQALSGAGYKGLNMHDNVIPFIEGEEEKVETEPLKILGKIENGAIIPDKRITISAHCNRVPVLHGHLASISVSFERKPTYQDILSLWNQPSSLDLPSAPAYPIQYLDKPNRPQIQLDRDAQQGMGVSVGRLRESPLFDWQCVALSHNAIRGGAGGGILIAEQLYQRGYLG